MRVTRKFLSTEYGGQNAQLIQHMNKSRSKDNPAMFPQRDYNPYLPLSTGTPGLMFSPRRDVLGPSWRLFIKNAGKGPANYDYYGDYSTTCVGYLTKEEFAHLKPIVSILVYHARENYSQTPGSLKKVWLA